MSEKDTPKYYIDPTDVINESLPEVVNDECETLPIEVRETIIKESDSPHKDILLQLTEVSKTAELLKLIDNSETKNMRKRVIDMLLESFIQKRMQTNNKLEDFKVKILESLMPNIENLDLELRLEALKMIHEITALDAQRPLDSFSDSNGFSSPTNNAGVVVNVNNATGENSVVNSTSVSSQPASMKELGGLNKTVKAWGDIPVKKLDDDVVMEVNTNATDSNR